MAADRYLVTFPNGAAAVVSATGLRRLLERGTRLLVTGFDDAAAGDDMFVNVDLDRPIEPRFWVTREDGRSHSVTRGELLALLERGEYLSVVPWDGIGAGTAARGRYIAK